LLADRAGTQNVKSVADAGPARRRSQHRKKTMDYCSTCRRHLNGALVCPGCGAYAPDIAPPPVLSPAAEPYGTEEAPAAPPSAPGRALAPAGPSGEGRAARRRQLARWKKNKRRAAAGTVIALVGGALTVAALPTDSGRGNADAAAAPDTALPDAAVAHRPTTASARPAERASRPAREAAPSATAPAAPRQRTAAPATAAPAPTLPARTASAAPEPPKAPAAQPATTAPAAPAEPPAASAPVPDEPQTPPAQTATTSPTEVCLLVLCLG
jgi:hypothetical protein